MKPQTYTVVGIMSGTSLDGMDLALCRFNAEDGKWSYDVIKVATINYDREWKDKLINAPYLNAEQFILLHNEYGRLTGNHVKLFLTDTEGADLVASHGHTVFHQPARRMTFQIGSGAAIAGECNITTVSDLRTLDVALGGQGAPLVPAGDKLLFGEYGFCLNLGGFANISNDNDGVRIACDLCPVNIVANHLAARIGLEYDRDGLAGRHGTLMPELVDELDRLGFYSLTGPRSLGREWVESEFMPVVEKYRLPVADALRSVYEHIAGQISRYINAYEPSKVLVTGGGAFNEFLIELIRSRSQSELVIPDEKTVKFKEAIIFAFLGLLRYLGLANSLASVTGAGRDSSSGVIYVIR